MTFSLDDNLRLKVIENSQKINDTKEIFLFDLLYILYIYIVCVCVCVEKKVNGQKIYIWCSLFIYLFIFANAF